MSFDAYAFGEICLYAIPLVIVLSIFISVILTSLAQNFSIGMSILVLVSYVLCVGIIVHEAAHRLFCAIFGIKVREAKYFSVERRGEEYISIGGYIDCEEVRSVIAAMFLGVAPLVVNGLLVAVIIYYNPVFIQTPYSWVLVYAGVALGLGARPSTQDLKIWLTVLARAPGRGLCELAILGIFGASVISLIIFQVNFWVVIAVLFSFLFSIVIKVRSKSGTPKSRYFPRT